jgi:hypothetical protein
VLPLTASTDEEWLRMSTEESKPRKPGTFTKNDPRRCTNPHELAGNVSKINRDIKRSLVDGAVRHGSDGQGTDGLVGYCFFLARDHPSVFGALLGRLVPLEVTGSVKVGISAVNVVPVPSGRYLTADEVRKSTAEPVTIDADVVEQVEDSEEEAA